MSGLGLRVLVVDDSATVREALRALLGRSVAVSSVETAADGPAALAKIDRVNPDVVTLDVEMPGMDGLATLRRIMASSPRPVIMLSAHTFAGADKTVRALELGAVDFVAKPGGRYGPDLESVAQDLIARIVAVGGTHRRARGWNKLDSVPALIAQAARPVAAEEPASQVVAVGASTGGTEAIHYFLANLPRALPAAVVVVQHMPAGFTTSFAKRLDDLCAIGVKEATQGELLVSGRAYIAPGDHHLLVRRDGPSTRVELSRAPAVNGHRPSVDVLFRSLVDTHGSSTIAIIMTGMGRDGAAGMRELHQRGALTIAQNEASCVVYGMPKAAVDDGAVREVMDLRVIPARVLAALREERRVSRGAP